MKTFYTISVNNYEQQTLLPFATFAGALLCVTGWTKDGRIKEGDRVEILEHTTTAHDVSILYKAFEGGEPCNN